MDIKKIDPELYKLIKREENRQKNTLNLIASENYASQTTLEVQGSIFSNKLAEGYINKRYCAGCEVIDELETLAIERLKNLFKVDHANVQTPTATQANIAVYYALLNPKDTVLAPKLSHGGHFSHGSLKHISAKMYNFSHYGVSRETEQFNFDEIEKIAKKVRPKLIIAGMSAYPRMFSYEEFRRIADDVGAYLLADIAHIAGLIIAELHPSPVPFADVITTSTHKTFGGPRGGGLIMCKQKFAEVIDAAVFPGTQGAPLMNFVASRALLFKNAINQAFRQKQRQIVHNAKELADSLQANGLRLVSGGTDTHLLLVDLKPQKITGKQAEEYLYSVGIASNSNAIPFENKNSKSPSGLRLGTVPLTCRGMKEREMTKIGEMISHILCNPKSKTIANKIKKEVETLTRKFRNLQVME
jgi:glycine hydroxymethyltransferase